MKPLNETQDALARRISQSLAGATFDDVLRVLPYIVSFAAARKHGSDDPAVIGEIIDVGADALVFAAMLPVRKGEPNIWQHLEKGNSPQPQQQREFCNDDDGSFSLKC